MSEPSIAETLAEHVPHIIFGAEWFAECLAPDCDWAESSDEDGDVQEAYKAHTAHVASVLAAREARLLAEARPSCGGCKGIGSHRRHCPRHPTYHPWRVLADRAEGIGDSVGEPGPGEPRLDSGGRDSRRDAEPPLPPHRRRRPMGGWKMSDEQRERALRLTDYDGNVTHQFTEKHVESIVNEALAEQRGAIARDIEALSSTWDTPHFDHGRDAAARIARGESA